MRRLTTFARSLFLFLWSLFVVTGAVAQVHTDGGGQVPHITGMLATLTYPTVVAMQWVTTASSHEGVWSASCLVSGAPDGATFVYSWTGSNLSFDTPAAQTTIVRASTTGSFNQTCTVTVSAPGYSATQVSASGTTVVIGGPLVLGVTNAKYSPPKTDSSGASYLQYFGRDPAIQNPPDHGQSPQWGTLAPKFAQPSGVTYDWTTPMPSTLEIIQYNGSTLSVSTMVTVGSLGASAAKADIHPHVNYIYAGVSYSDDDDQMPTSGANTTRITSHEPISTSVSTVATGSTNTQGPPSWSYVSTYSILVTDCVTDFMPALDVNEDFTTLPPPLTINGNQYTFKCNLDGAGWTTNGSGIFSPDYVGCYNLPQAYPSTGSAAYVGTHIYFGGTLGTYGTSAVAIGTWNLSVWTNLVTHSQ